MINREISSALLRYLKSFPVVLITGSRQVGKTTLVRSSLQNFKYVLLEDPDRKNLALTDPRRFLEAYPPPTILDEFQNVPNLTGFLQGVVDENRNKAGQFVLTGSQNFLMMEQVNQSLAGRIGILTMYGLSSKELPASAKANNDEALGNLILRGTYPELWSHPEIVTRDWYGSYVQSYIERDVRRLAQVGDLLAFERFVRVCAARTGQVLNYSDLASDSGVSVPTAQRWLSILQSTFIVKLVPPYFENISSRVRKAPKLYFMDTGLAAYLMGFRDPSSVLGSPQYGALFETLVYGDFIKQTSADGEVPEHYYLQTKSKVGADLIIRDGQKLKIIEIKAARTLSPAQADQLIATKAELNDKISELILVGPFENSTQFVIHKNKIQVRSWTDLTY
jgi:predicted AAA+ superfamily ATPase